MPVERPFLGSARPMPAFARDKGGSASQHTEPNAGSENIRRVGPDGKARLNLPGGILFLQRTRGKRDSVPMGNAIIESLD